MSSIHREAAEGFARVAAEYERGRPGYPPEAIGVVAKRLGIGPGSRVVDLAAGTGKLTRALTGLGAQLMAIEPLGAMRAQLEQAVPGVEVRDGTAERMPLRDGTVDAVLVAQAFHWFDVEVAAVEIARVLVPGGGLGVIRNQWDESVPWVRELQQRMEAARPGSFSQRHSDWPRRLAQTGRFGALHEQVIPHVVTGDRTVLLDRVSSISYVALLSKAERACLLGDIGAILDRHGVGREGEPLPMRHHTHVFWAMRAA